MQEIVCNVDDVVFDIEVALERQLGAQPLPFEGMDSKYSTDATKTGRFYCNANSNNPKLGSERLWLISKV